MHVVAFSESHDTLLITQVLQGRLLNTQFENPMQVSLSLKNRMERHVQGLFLHILMQSLTVEAGAVKATVKYEAINLNPNNEPSYVSLVCP